MKRAEDVISENKGKYKSIQIYTTNGNGKREYCPAEGYGDCVAGKEHTLNSTATYQEALEHSINNGVLEITIDEKVNIYTGEYPN